MVITYYGVATEWLPSDRADRRKLGKGSLGKSDEESGLFASIDDICHLQAGDVALLKGESWSGNTGNGLIHRSPQIQCESPRLMLTLDFVG